MLSNHFIDAGPTIEFCLMIDSTFDILNIRSPHGKYLKGPLSQKNGLITSFIYFNASATL